MKLPARVLGGPKTDSVFDVKNLLKSSRHGFSEGEDECVGKPQAKCGRVGEGGEDGRTIPNLR